MPHRTRAWIWAGRTAAAAAVIGLAGYLAAAGLDEAGRLAAPVGLVIALAALLAPYLLPAFQPPVTPPAPPADPASAEIADPASAEIIVATDGLVAVERFDHLTHHQGPPQRVPSPVLVVQVPALASVFQHRAVLRGQVDAARPGGSVVLSGGGGVGKSQLAANYAHGALAAGTDLVVWADASTAGAVIEVFARAAARVQAARVSGEDTEADAREFLVWAATTSRSWLVVLDDITDPGQLAQWWPASHTGTGWVLGTTRRRDAALGGGGRALVDVGVYTSAEANAYLTGRLTAAGQGRLLDGAGELAGELGHLPLALGHAAAYLIDQQVSCTAYLDRYRAGRDRLDDLMPASADGDGYGRTVAATLLLALDAADARDPAGLARPAIRLAALLDPAGHPAALWATRAVTGYLARNRTGLSSGPEPDPQPDPEPEAVTIAEARDAVLLLHRYGLATFDDQAGPRAVHVHALTGRAACESTPADRASGIALAAADALGAVWPDPAHADPPLADALRTNAVHLASHAKDALWHPNMHPVLSKAGNSLLDAGLHTAAITYWQRVALDAARIRGPEHPETLTAQANLALSYGRAGRIADAITIGERVAADFARVRGPEHPSTLTAQANLAASYGQAGRTADAITIEERVAADFARTLGPEHPSTLNARANLAVSYARDGRTADAVTIGEHVAADRARVLGSEHPLTLTAQANLAACYQQAGRTAEAITIGERVAADRARLLGPEHPHTLLARANVAGSYAQAGRTADAITIEEQVAADSARILGPEHPSTLTAEANLAISYWRAGRTADAITIGERVVADFARIRGREHPDTMTAQVNLAACYRQVGRTAEAITIGERVAADRARLLGPEHPSTLTAQGNLAASYAQAGRIADAITIGERVAADCPRILGPEHPDTMTAQANLAACYRQAGRTGDAITLQERVAADRARLLGPEHPDTVAVVKTLREWQRRPRWRRRAADMSSEGGPHG
jgi:tetratricopeptide (TPR) repeat protein